MIRSTRGGIATLSTGSALFLAAQFPPRFAGAALVLALAWNAMASFGGRRSRPAPPDIAGRLDVIRVGFLGAACLALVILQWALLPNELKPLTALHFLVYAAVVLGRRSEAPSWPSLRLIRVVTWINALLLPTLYFSPLREVFWYETPTSGQIRYQSYYLEPSIAALMCVLNIVLLWFQKPRSEDRMALVALNLICIALTYSGSGFLLLGLVALTQLSWKNFVRTAKLLALLLPLLVVWLNTEAGAEAVNTLILNRISGIAALEADDSVYVRAVVPFLFLFDLLTSGVHALLGAGIGGIESFIRLNEYRFVYLLDYKGDLFTDINNGYVVAVALFGAPLAVIATLALANAVARSPAPPAIKVYVVVYPFLSGFVIHPLLWLLIAMLGFARRRRRIKPLLEQCASPS